jgi:hypothetical protein
MIVDKGGYHGHSIVDVKEFVTAEAADDERRVVELGSLLPGCCHRSSIFMPKYPPGERTTMPPPIFPPGTAGKLQLATCSYFSSSSTVSFKFNNSRQKQEVRPRGCK